VRGRRVERHLGESSRVRRALGSPTIDAIGHIC